MATKLYDKNGMIIHVGDVLKVFHFVGARNKKHYMYKQPIAVVPLGQDKAPHLKISHLDMSDSYYYEHLDGRTLADYEIVQAYPHTKPTNPRTEGDV